MALLEPLQKVKCQFCSSTDLRQDGNMHQCNKCGNYQPNVRMVKPFNKDDLFQPRD